MSQDSGNVKIPTFRTISTTKYDVKYLLVNIIINTKIIAAQGGTTAS
jgi:hypothetical protein